MSDEAFAHRLHRARARVQAGEGAALFAEWVDRVLPAGNPALYWDRFVIVALGTPAVQSPSGSPPAPAPTSATALDLEALCHADPPRASRLRARWCDGQRCLIIRDQERIVARQWVIGDRPLYLSNSGLRFVPPVRPARWCHDIFVDPGQRRRGHFASLIFGARTDGETTAPCLYGEIHAGNAISIAAHLRLGYRILHTVTVVSVLGLKLYRLRDEEGRIAHQVRHAWNVPHL